LEFAMLRLAFLMLPPVQLMSLAAISVLNTANSLVPTPAYQVRLLSEKGGLVQTAGGFGIETEAIGEDDFDTLVVGAFAGQPALSPDLVHAVRRLAADARRVASVCTGAFLLGEAGLLDGRRVTTHWRSLPQLERRFPAATVLRDRLYVNDGRLWTAAGMTASIDLMLAFVEADLGEEIATAVAERMVLERRRPGGGSQRSGLLGLQPKTDRIEAALAYAKRNLKSPLTVAELADASRLSPRQFSRAFTAALGQPPAKVVERLRVEAAHALILASHHSLDVISREVGFADRERMRRAFVRVHGRAPREIRRATVTDIGAAA
jgi:transcriptional regulator GlxA family with amidase domain